MATSSLAASRGGTFEKSTTKSITSETASQRKPVAQTRRGFWQRFLDSIIEARQRQADREIARFVQSRGGKLTDETEREITSRFLSRSPGNW